MLLIIRHCWRHCHANLFAPQTAGCSRRMLSKLRGLSSDSIPNDFGTVLESMCKWGKIGDVLELISDWLADSLATEGSSSNSQAPPGGPPVSCLYFVDVIWSFVVEFFNKIAVQEGFDGYGQWCLGSIESKPCNNSIRNVGTLRILSCHVWWSGKFIKLDSDIIRLEMITRFQFLSPYHIYLCILFLIKFEYESMILVYEQKWSLHCVTKTWKTLLLFTTLIPGNLVVLANLLWSGCIWVIPCQINQWFASHPSDFDEIWHTCRWWPKQMCAIFQRCRSSGFRDMTFKKNEKRVVFCDKTSWSNVNNFFSIRGGKLHDNSF